MHEVVLEYIAGWNWINDFLYLYFYFIMIVFDIRNTLTSDNKSNVWVFIEKYLFNIYFLSHVLKKKVTAFNNIYF